MPRYWDLCSNSTPSLILRAQEDHLKSSGIKQWSIPWCIACKLTYLCSVCRGQMKASCKLKTHLCMMSQGTVGHFYKSFAWGDSLVIFPSPLFKTSYLFLICNLYISFPFDIRNTIFCLFPSYYLQSTIAFT